MNAPSRATGLLLNLGHALDHMFLLIFAAAVGSIAAEFGIARWEDLMPYGSGAFLMFGLGSLPAGRLGDLWGRRPMMLVFYFGMGLSAMLVALSRGPWTLGIALGLLGTFASIYHPVGIPMLVQGAQRPGRTIGVNGLAGNLGVAVAALLTGLLIELAGWRQAFVVPGVAALVAGIAFARIAPRETPPSARAARPGAVALTRPQAARIFLVMTATSVTANLLFNFSTNGNAQLLAERMAGVVHDPALLGLLLGAVYAVASIAQVVVGVLLDRVPLKRLYFAVVALQVPLFLLAVHAQGWWLLGLQFGFMVFIFGAIPFIDATIVRFVDDRLRSRVAGMRLTVSLGLSAAAVWALGPVVKAGGFTTLLMLMAAISVATIFAISALPGEPVARTRALAA